MPAKFVLKRGTTGKFRFSLHAANGQIVATSEAYETKRAALAGIESVRKNAGGAPVDDLTQTDGAAAPAPFPAVRSSSGAPAFLRTDSMPASAARFVS